MLLSTVLCVVFACGFAMFHLANAGFFVLAVAITAIAGAVLAIDLGGFDESLLNAAAALGTLQLGYFAGLAVAAFRVRLEAAMGVSDRRGEA